MSLDLTEHLHIIVAKGFHNYALLPSCPTLHLLRINLVPDPARRTNVTSEACCMLADAVLPSLHVLVFNIETGDSAQKPPELQETVEELLESIGFALDYLLSGTRFPALQRVVIHIGVPPSKLDREWWLSRIRHWFPLCCKDNKVCLTCAEPKVSFESVAMSGK